MFNNLVDVNDTARYRCLDSISFPERHKRAEALFKKTNDYSCEDRICRKIASAILLYGFLWGAVFPY